MGHARGAWGGRLVRIEQAQGILVAALGVLAGVLWVCANGTMRNRAGSMVFGLAVEGSWHTVQTAA